MAGPALPPVLPDHLTQALAAVTGLAEFLRRSGFPEREGRAATCLGIDGIAALCRTRDREAPADGIAEFARTLVRDIHTSRAFDAHASAVAKTGTRVPRLRALVPSLPAAGPLRAATGAAFAASAEAERTASGQPWPRTTLDFYLAPAAFAETGLDADGMADLLFTHRPEVAWTAMEAALVTVSRDSGAPEPVLAPLLRAGCRWCAASRAYAEVTRLGARHEEIFGPQEALLEALWYAAWRTDGRAAAEQVIDRWETLTPLDPGPLIARSVVLAPENPGEALELLADSGAEAGLSTRRANVLFVEAALALGQVRRAERALRASLAADMRAGTEPPLPYLLAMHNLAIARGRPVRILQDVFARQGCRLSWDKGFDIDSVRDDTPPPDELASLPGPVAVVMPAHNAAPFLARAMEGVLRQSHSALTLLVVDDGSTDNTAEIAEERAATDPRVRVLRMGRNRGAYVARNEGIRAALEAGAALVGFCDADDWWLRDHLHQHLAALADTPNAALSRSRWFRVDNAGRIECGQTGQYDGFCPHSTLYRREVFERAGLYDPVRFGADREFEARVARHLGPGAVASIDRVLTLGRRHGASLTVRGSGALDASGASEARMAYWQAWNRWHLETLQAGAVPHLSGDPDAARPFPAPPGARAD